jgi:hypothetical protein
MKKFKGKITMIVEKTETGFSAYSEKQPIFTTGRTVPELMENALEAASLYYEDEEILVGQEDLRFELDFKEFFDYYQLLNAKILAKRIGMNPSLLSQYIRGHKKPSVLQTEKILAGIHQIGRELAEINLIYKR